MADLHLPAHLAGHRFVHITWVIGLIALVVTTIGFICLAFSFAPLSATTTVTFIDDVLTIPASAAPLLLIGTVLAIAANYGLAKLHQVLSTTIVSAKIIERELTTSLQRTHRKHAGAVRSAELDRYRIERDLHDVVQPRLVSVAMKLGLAKQQLHRDPTKAEALIDEAHASTKTAVTELRQLARGIYVSVLTDRGLDAALSALAARSVIPTQLDVKLNTEPPARAAQAIYFTVAEAMTNAAKHSRATEIQVLVRDSPGENPSLWARIEDNGTGNARVQPGGGLDGLTNRIAAADGTFRLVSPAGGPTILEVSVPCES